MILDFLDKVKYKSNIIILFVVVKYPVHPIM